MLPWFLLDKHDRLPRRTDNCTTLLADVGGLGRYPCLIPINSIRWMRWECGAFKLYFIKAASSQKVCQTCFWS